MDSQKTRRQSVGTLLRRNRGRAHHWRARGRATELEDVPETKPRPRLKTRDRGRREVRWNFVLNSNGSFSLIRCLIEVIPIRGVRSWSILQVLKSSKRSELLVRRYGDFTELSQETSAMRARVFVMSGRVFAAAELLRAMRGRVFGMGARAFLSGIGSERLRWFFIF